MTSENGALVLDQIRRDIERIKDDLGPIRQDVSEMKVSFARHEGASASQGEGLSLLKSEVRDLRGKLASLQSNHRLLRQRVLFIGGGALVGSHAARDTILGLLGG